MFANHFHQIIQTNKSQRVKTNLFQPPTTTVINLHRTGMIMFANHQQPNKSQLVKSNLFQPPTKSLPHPHPTQLNLQASWWYRVAQASTTRRGAWTIVGLIFVLTIPTAIEVFTDHYSV
jgi:hypothetical protein